MTKTLEFKQSSHLNPALTDPQTSTFLAGKLLGRWVNTNRETRGITECVIDQDGDHVRISIVGVGVDGPIKWPRTTAKVLANLEEEAGQRAVALEVTFNLDFMRVETSIRLNKGVLVIVLYITFLDGSGRSNYVNREFFYSPAEG
jgi:hypothetical protein